MPAGVYDHYKIRGRIGKYRVPIEVRICAAPGCNTTFECKVNSRRKYCCRRCSNQTTRITRKHRKYTSPMKGKKRPPFSEEWKQNMSKAKKGKGRGKDNSNWKGGKTKETLRIRFCDAYIKWRQSVFERDNFTCQYCGKRKGQRLAAHHIQSFIDCPEDRFNVDNGVTFCNGCHVHLHNMIRRRDPDAELIIKVVGYRMVNKLELSKSVSEQRNSQKILGRESIII
jgi:hypothetical protein